MAPVNRVLLRSNPALLVAPCQPADERGARAVQEHRAELSGAEPLRPAWPSARLPSINSARRAPRAPPATLLAGVARRGAIAEMRGRDRDRLHVVFAVHDSPSRAAVGALALLARARANRAAAGQDQVQHCCRAAPFRRIKRRLGGRRSQRRPRWPLASARAFRRLRSRPTLDARLEIARVEGFRLERPLEIFERMYANTRRTAYPAASNLLAPSRSWLSSQPGSGSDRSPKRARPCLQRPSRAAVSR